MNRFIISSLILFLWTLSFPVVCTGQEAEMRYNYSAKNKKLKVIISDIETLTGKKIAYSPGIIEEDIIVNVKVRNRNLETLLNEIFTKINIRWLILEGQIVLQKLPPGEHIIKPKLLPVSGTIRDFATGEVLAGVQIIVQNSGTQAFTNAYGYYSLKLPAGDATLIFTLSGYKTRIEKRSITTSGVWDSSLEILTVNYEPVEIQEQKNRSAFSLTEIAGSSGNLEQMKGIGGQTDVLKAVNSTPGFNMFGDGSTLFFVRGGQSNQNLILIDEAPIYNPSHMFGFFTALSPDAIREVKAWKGSFPARYGGRLSSVIELHSKEGNLKKYEVSGNLGPYASILTVEGPLKKDMSSFLLSFRRSHMEWLRPSDYTPESFDFNFFDINLKLNAQLSPRNRIYLTAYTGGDNFSQLTESSLKTNGISWKHIAGTLRWNHLAGNNIFTNTTLVFSNYRYFLYLNGLHTDYWGSEVTAAILKTDMSWFAALGHIFRAGAEFTNHLSDPGNIILGNQQNPAFAKKFPMYRSLSATFYLSHEARLFNNHLLLDYGLRLPIWGNYGPFTISYYNAAFEPFAQTIVPPDSVYYLHTGFEPRFTATINLGKGLNAMAGYSRTMQYFQALSNSSSPFTTLETWVPAGPVVSPQRADLFSTGISKEFHEGVYRFSVEGYYKIMGRQIDYKDHANLLYNEFLEGELRFGESRAWGLEAMLMKSAGRVTGWLSYTYGRVKRESPDLNNGIPYHPFWDRPHQIQAFLNTKPLPALQLSLAWYYMTGGTTSVPSGFYYVNGQAVPYYDSRNQTRLPDYHRLDLQAEFRLGKPNARFQHSLSLAVYNVYGRKNPFVINFNKIMDDSGNFRIPANVAGNNKVVPTELSVAGMVPSINYKFRF